MIVDRRNVLSLVAGAAAVPAFGRRAFALDYPTRPVRIVVGFAAGGAPDVIARLLAQWLSERLKRPFVVENHPGVDSNLALEDVARAAADGYTLFEVSVANAVNASLYQGVDIERAIAPIVGIASAAFVVVVNPSSSVQTIPELIADAKAHPGKLNFGSPPSGTPPYLSVSLFKQMAAIDFVQVPFRNSPQAVEELLAGRLDVAISDMSALQFVNSGKLRALAVTTAARQAAMPEVPSVAEFLPGFEATTWYGLGAAKHTPAAIIDLLSAAAETALKDPAHAARLTNLALTVQLRPPAEFGRFIAAETAKWGEVIKASHIKPR